MRCECGKEFEGNFCPNCGRPASNIVPYNAAPENPQKPKGLRSLAKKFLWGIIIIVLLFGLPFKSNTGDRSKENTENADSAAESKTESKTDIRELLSDTVTEDYMPGTYQASNGDFFAINVYDESIFHINVTLAQIFHGDDYSTCSIVSSEAGWLEEGAVIDVGDKTIIVTSDSDTTYKYDFKKKKLTLTDSSGKKKTYTKISDEYNPNVLCDLSYLSIDNITGVYKMYSSSNKAVVEKNDDSTLNIYLLNKVYQDDTSKTVIERMAENVPLEKLFKNNAICLKGKDNFDIYYIYFDSRYAIGTEGEFFGYGKTDTTDYDISSKIQEFKSKYSQMDYNYSSFSDAVVLNIPDTSIRYSFNKDWYKVYNTYTANGINMRIEYTDDSTVQMFFDNVLRYTFSDDSCSGGDNCNFVVYHCDQGIDFDYYPKFNDSGHGKTPMIRFHEFDAKSMGYSFEVEYGLDFNYSEQDLSTDLESQETYEESTPSEEGLKFLGRWADNRCVVTIISNDKINYRIDVLWGSSAFETVEWQFDAKYNSAEDRLDYSDGIKIYHHSDQYGNEENEILAEDLNGYFMMYDPTGMLWYDETDKDGEDCRFARLE